MAGQIADYEVFMTSLGSIAGRLSAPYLVLLHYADRFRPRIIGPISGSFS